MVATALLLNAVLFGGMVFFSFGFAPVLFKQLPISQVRPLLRGTFPYYYLSVIGLSLIAAVAAYLVSPMAALLVGIIFLSTLYARQILMGQINAATDRGDERMFKMLHGLSVVVQLIQIGLSGWAVVVLAQA
ncbi:MAG: DUF4149 domain-containing protein [Pseudomonadota bacterium]